MKFNVLTLKISKMKTIYLYVCVLICSMGVAQASQGIGHQFILRNADGEPLADTEVSIRTSLLQGAADGQEVYAETHHLVSNVNGIVTYVIGNGNVEEGVFEDIDWSELPYFIQIENAAANNDVYSVNIVSQLHSVPFSHHAHTAAAYSETDPEFNAWDRSSGITVTESQIIDLGDYIYEETQTLADVIALGNEIDTQVRGLSDPVDEQDATNKQYVDDIVDQLLLRIEALEDALDMQRKQRSE